MTENGSSQPPIDLSNLGAAYGRTVLGGQHQATRPTSSSVIPGTKQACPCSIGRFCPIHSDASGPNAKAGTAGTRYIPSAVASPHDQIAQLVATFLDGLIGQITARVVRELEPVLAEQAQLFRDLMMPEHEVEPEPEPIPYCPRCAHPACQLNAMRRETYLDVMFVEGSNDWAWAHWTANPCAVRVAIDQRLFYVDQPIAGPDYAHYGHFVIAEITNGTEKSPKCRTGNIDGIVDVIRLLSSGLTFSDAIEESSFLLTEDAIEKSSFQLTEDPNE